MKGMTVMKKLISIVLVFATLTAGVFAFATDNTSNNSKWAEKAAEAKEKISSKLQFINDTKPLFDEVRRDRITVLQLKLDVKNAFEAAKTRIKDLKKAESSLTPEQIAAIKADLGKIKEDKAKVKDTLGNINDKRPELNQAKHNNDTAACEKILNDIIAVQQSRITLLKQVVDDLNSIAKV